MNWGAMGETYSPFIFGRQRLQHTKSKLDVWAGGDRSYCF